MLIRIRFFIAKICGLIEKGFIKKFIKSYRVIGNSVIVVCAWIIVVDAWVVFAAGDCDVVAGAWDSNAWVDVSGAWVVT